MDTADRALVLDRLLRILVTPGDPGEYVALVHEGKPQPKQRAGSFKGRRFTPRETEIAERDLAYCFRSAVLTRPWYTNVAIVAVFFLPRRQRSDADNFMKTVMDAATKANVWRDDSQVTAQASFVEYDPQRPRTLIALAPTTSSLDRTVPVRKRRGALPLEETV